MAASEPPCSVQTPVRTEKMEPQWERCRWSVWQPRRFQVASPKAGLEAAAGQRRVCETRNRRRNKHRAHKERRCGGNESSKRGARIRILNRFQAFENPRSGRLPRLKYSKGRLRHDDEGLRGFWLFCALRAA